MSELYNLKNTVTLYNPLYLPFEILLWMLFTVWYAKLIYIIGGDVNALYLLDGSVYYQCYILRKLSIFPPSETTKMYLFRIYLGFILWFTAIEFLKIKQNNYTHTDSQPLLLSVCSIETCELMEWPKKFLLERSIMTTWSVSILKWSKVKLRVHSTDCIISNLTLTFTCYI